MALPFLDTNILLRHLTNDHPDHSPRASAYLARIEQGEIRVRIADSVVFETVFTLQTHYRRTRPSIRSGVLPIIDLPGIVLPGKKRWYRAFGLYVETALSLADAHHVATMEDLGMDVIVSFDRGLDKIADIVRVEP